MQSEPSVLSILRRMKAKDPFSSQDLNNASYSPRNTKSYREREPPVRAAAVLL
jgi:hypothetical protein